MISKSRLAVFFSFFAFVIINFQSHITRVVIDLILSSALAFAVIKSKVRIRTDKIFFRDNTTAFAVSCFISLILGLRFYNYWTISGAVTKIYFGNAAIANILLIIVTLLLSAGSSLILSAVISRHYNSFYSLKTLKADNTSFNHETQDIMASGDIFYQDGEVTVKSDTTLTTNLKTNDTRLDKATYRLNGTLVRGYADEAVITDVS